MHICTNCQKAMKDLRDVHQLIFSQVDKETRRKMRMRLRSKNMM